jgi:DMSO/TMAO reductase YedYZ molybdopterin-dependent catalytic subunit
VASVKWLTEIEVIGELFSGHYQTETYFFEWQRGEQVVREPISLQCVRSLITEPEPDSEVEQGELPIRGVAWSGAAPIARVEVRIGDGPWQNARLVGERKRHSWHWFWPCSGRFEVVVLFGILSLVAQLVQWSRIVIGLNQEHA